MTQLSTIRRIMVPVGELRVSIDSGAELYTVTGSCVALILYDNMQNIAGMLHVVLPGQQKSRHRDLEETYYADTGVPLLIDTIMKHGAKKENLSAMIIGGGMLVADGNKTDIGKKNIEAVTRLLDLHHIPITKTAVGGNISRSISVGVANGRETVRSIDQMSPQSGNFGKEKLVSETLESVFAEMRVLRPNVRVSGQLLKEMHQQIISWKKAKEIISRDLILCMHVFRIANSLYYGLPYEISTVDKAYALLGEHQLRKICLLAATSRQYEASPAISGLFATIVSQHCLAVGIVAQYLAAALPTQIQEEVFVAGLFHGIGGLCARLVSIKNNEKIADNGTLSRLILSEWKFPDVISKAVASFYLPKANEKDRASLLASYIHVSCGICRLLGIVTSVESQGYILNEDVMMRIGLKKDVAGILPGVYSELKRKGLTQYLETESLT